MKQGELNEYDLLSKHFSVPGISYEECLNSFSQHIGDFRKKCFLHIVYPFSGINGVEVLVVLWSVIFFCIQVIARISLRKRVSADKTLIKYFSESFVRYLKKFHSEEIKSFKLNKLWKENRNRMSEEDACRRTDFKFLFFHWPKELYPTIEYLIQVKGGQKTVDSLAVGDMTRSGIIDFVFKHTDKNKRFSEYTPRHWEYFCGENPVLEIDKGLPEIDKQDLVEKFYEIFKNNQNCFDRAINMDLATIKGSIDEPSLGIYGEYKLICDDYRDQLQKSLQKDSHITVAVLGEVSSGKSKFLNHLLGESFLPSNLQETTPILTRLLHTDKEPYSIVYKEMSQCRVELRDAGSFLDKRLGLSDKEGCRQIDIFLRKNILKTVTFVDTPGLNTTTEKNEKITLKYMINADVVFWMMNINKAGTADEVKHIKTLRNMGKKVVIIAGKIDLIEGGLCQDNTEEEYNRQLMGVLRQIREKFKDLVEPENIIPYSNYWYEDFVKGEASREDKCGIKDIWRAIDEVRKHKDEISREQMAIKLARFNKGWKEDLIKKIVQSEESTCLRNLFDELNERVYKSHEDYTKGIEEDLSASTDTLEYRNKLTMLGHNAYFMADQLWFSGRYFKIYLSEISCALKGFYGKIRHQAKNDVLFSYLARIIVDKTQVTDLSKEDIALDLNNDIFLEQVLRTGDLFSVKQREGLNSVLDMEREIFNREHMSLHETKLSDFAMDTMFKYLGVLSNHDLPISIRKRFYKAIDSDKDVGRYLISRILLLFITASDVEVEKSIKIEECLRYCSQMNGKVLWVRKDEVLDHLAKEIGSDILRDYFNIENNFRRDKFILSNKDVFDIAERSKDFLFLCSFLPETCGTPFKEEISGILERGMPYEKILKELKYLRRKWEKERQLQGEYNDGKRNGLWKFYYENGQLKEEGEYNDGKRNGLWKDYSENGQLRGEVEYKGGKRNGLWKLYYENGQLQGEVEYKGGKRNGLCKLYYENGQLQGEVEHKGGKRNGLWKFYYGNGQLRKRVEYKDGKRNGLGKDYYENGQLRKEVYYKVGKRISLLKFYY